MILSTTSASCSARQVAVVTVSTYHTIPVPAYTTCTSIFQSSIRIRSSRNVLLDNLVDKFEKDSLLLGSPLLTLLPQHSQCHRKRTAPEALIFFGLFKSNSSSDALLLDMIAKGLLELPSVDRVRFKELDTWLEVFVMIVLDLSVQLKLKLRFIVRV